MWESGTSKISMGNVHYEKNLHGFFLKTVIDGGHVHLPKKERERKGDYTAHREWSHCILFFISLSCQNLGHAYALVPSMFFKQP